jgi:hypothetical protein
MRRVDAGVQHVDGDTRSGRRRRVAVVEGEAALVDAVQTPVRRIGLHALGPILPAVGVERDDPPVLLHPQHAGPRAEPVDLVVGEPGREPREGLAERQRRPHADVGRGGRSVGVRACVHDVGHQVTEIVPGDGVPGQGNRDGQLQHGHRGGDAQEEPRHDRRRYGSCIDGNRDTIGAGVTDVTWSTSLTIEFDPPRSSSS